MVGSDLLLEFGNFCPFSFDLQLHALNYDANSSVADSK